MNLTTIIILVLALFLIFKFAKKTIMNSKIKNYTPSEIKSLLKTGKNLILVDVRTSSERNADKINNSIHIPLHEVSKRINELEKYRMKEIVCYCRSGNRSLTAASILLKNGFNAANLKGGISYWNLG